MSESVTDGPRDGITPEIARNVRLVVLDVDGVLTDGGVYIGKLPDGTSTELKRFDIQDGLGIKMLMRAGVEVAFVSGRVSQATTARARELGVDECHQDAAAHKLPVVQALLVARALTWDQVAVVADDLADLPVLRKAGLAVAVANAAPEVLAAAGWQTRAMGGRGAVREFARALLTARGEWTEMVESYCRERGG